MLFYSRPKGKYVGKTETEKVLLDFYLVNTELSATGNKVKVLVNGENEFTIDAWKPFFLEGLPMGDNKVKLTLVDKDGQHVHLIVDDGPYDAVYASPFEKAIPDGPHYVLGFLGRSYHESIKTKAAGNALKVEVKAGSFAKSEPVKEPMLFYSRPKGKYVGKAETGKVMLDFYLVNTELSATGNKVKVLVNGEKEFTIDTWKPVFLEGLPMGDNKVKLTLVEIGRASCRERVSPRV